MRREAACLSHQKIPVRIGWKKKKKGERTSQYKRTNMVPLSALCNCKDCFAENSKPQKKKRGMRRKMAWSRSPTSVLRVASPVHQSMHLLRQRGLLSTSHLQVCSRLVASCTLTVLLLANNSSSQENHGLAYGIESSLHACVSEKKKACMAGEEKGCTQPTPPEQA